MYTEYTGCTLCPRECKVNRNKKTLGFCGATNEAEVNRIDLHFMEEPVKKFFRLAPGKEVRLKGAYFVTCTDFVKDENGVTVYTAEKGGKIIGYCVVNFQKGYGGDVKVMTGVNADGTVNKVTILEHGETPGLGAKSTDDAFKGQYIGKTAGEITVVKNSPGASDVQAISGATITSNAVTKAVNEAKKCIEEATK